MLKDDMLKPYIFVVLFHYTLPAAIGGREGEHGYQIKRINRQRVKPEVIADFECVNDISLLSDVMNQAR